MKRIVIILCVYSGFIQAGPTPPENAAPTPSRTANVYLVNIMPFALSLSYASNAPANAITQGPALIQPGQAVKIMHYALTNELKSTTAFDFSTNVRGTIPETSEVLTAALVQKVSPTTTLVYSMATDPTIPIKEWSSPDAYQSRKITAGQTDVFVDYIARTNTAGIDIYYSIAPKQIALNSGTVQTIVGNRFQTIDQLAPRMWKEIFTPSASALKPLDPWIPARPEIRYDQTAFLGTHASFANPGDGFLYTKQLWNIKQQLDNGVRVIQLTIYPDGDNSPKLCLDACATAQFIRTGAHVTALETLKVIKEWLDANKDEVVTLLLDTKLSADETFHLIKQSELMPLALTKEIWDPANHTGAWPRIGWMRLYKQRLVIFDASPNVNPDKYGYTAKQHLVQNTPRTLDIAKAAQELGTAPKPTPRLFQCNYYGSIAAPLPLHNTPEQIKKLLEAVRSHHYLDPNQAPNFIMLDHVEMGNVMPLINEINKAAQSQ